MYELVIVGAGPAGLYAATCAAMNELKAVVIESSSEFGGQLTLYKDKAVYDMPGFSKINAGDLVKSFYDQYKNYEKEVPILLNTQAIDVIHYDDFFEIKTNQGILQTKTILLANGGGMFQPKRLEQGDDLEGIFYVIDNLKAFENKDVVVLGGGDSAVDWALTLEGIAKSITLIHRRDEFRAHQRNVDLLKQKHHVLTPYTVYEVKGEKKIEGLVIEHTVTKELVEIKTDALLVFYGVNPVKNRVDVWNVRVKDNSIVVAQNMVTSREGIYAVGNSITYEGKLKMIVTALGEAATAIGAITKFLYPERTKTYKH